MGKHLGHSALPGVRPVAPACANRGLLLFVREGAVAWRTSVPACGPSPGLVQQWKCPICNPAFSKALEGTMERSVGSRLWAQDKKGLWGKARVLGVRPARPAGGDTGGSEPSASSQPANEAPPSSAAAAGGAAGEDAGSPEQVKVSFYGYSAKFDEWISVGDGKLRPLELGPPIVEEYANEYYVMGDVLDMRQRNGRKEYLTSWEGFALPTWEPKSAFVGDGAKRKLEVFLEALRARGRNLCAHVDVGSYGKSVRVHSRVHNLDCRSCVCGVALSCPVLGPVRL